MLKKKWVKIPDGVGWKGSGFVRKKIQVSAKNVYKSWKTIENI